MATKNQTERQQRVAEEIRHLLSDALIRGDFFVPGFKSSMVMVTDVRVSPDFSWATVFVRPIGPQAADETAKILNEHKGFFRKIIGQKIRLRITPDVRFLVDESFDEAQKIEALFQNPKVKADIEKKDDED